MKATPSWSAASGSSGMGACPNRLRTSPGAPNTSSAVRSAALAFATSALSSATLRRWNLARVSRRHSSSWSGLTPGHRPSTHPGAMVAGGDQEDYLLRWSIEDGVALLQAPAMTWAIYPLTAVDGGDTPADAGRGQELVGRGRNLGPPPVMVNPAHTCVMECWDVALH